MVMGLSLAMNTNINAQQGCVLKADLLVTPAGCKGDCNGTASVTNLEAGTSYQFLWSNGSTAQSITGLCEGPVTLTITQNGECTFVLTGGVTAPEELKVQCTATVPTAPGVITASASGGTMPYSYVWNTNPVQLGAMASNLPAGTYTVTATDGNGCIGSTACDIIAGPKANCQARTQTMGGWGAVPHGGNPGTYLHANFTGAFPSGLTVGCTRKLKLTTAQAVTDFLPSGSTARVLPVGTLTNPGGAYNNVFAGQVVALTVSVGMDNYDVNFGASGISLGAHLIASGPFTGWSVNALLAEANLKLGGCASSYSVTDLKDAVDLVNNTYVDCTRDTKFLYCDETKIIRNTAYSTNVANSFSVFPNPAGNKLNVQFDATSTKPATVVLMDLSGRVMMSNVINTEEGINNYTMDLNQMPKGIYIVKLLQNDNVFKSRVVVQ